MREVLLCARMCTVGVDGLNERVRICGVSGVDDGDNASRHDGEAHEGDKNCAQHIRHGNLLGDMRQSNVRDENM